jgi:hypothetical protein
MGSKGRGIEDDELIWRRFGKEKDFVAGRRVLLGGITMESGSFGESIVEDVLTRGIGIGDEKVRLSVLSDTISTSCGSSGGVGVFDVDSKSKFFSMRQIPTNEHRIRKDVTLKNKMVDTRLKSAKSMHRL